MKQRRTTKQKQLVLQIVQAHCDHPSADQIYQEIREIDRRVSRGTVYRNLGCLSEDGEITHVKVPGADRFDCRTEQHYHFLCTGCNAVYDVPISYQQEMDEQMEKQTEFQIFCHRTIFEGLCEKCQKLEQQCNHSKMA